MDENDNKQNLVTTYEVIAIEYIKGRKIREISIGYTPHVPNVGRKWFDIISADAFCRGIDVMFTDSIFFEIVGIVAKQYKRSAPKTKYVYVVRFMDIPF